MGNSYCSYYVYLAILLLSHSYRIFEQSVRILRGIRYQKPKILSHKVTLACYYRVIMLNFLPKGKYLVDGKTYHQYYSRYWYNGKEWCLKAIIKLIAIHSSYANYGNINLGKQKQEYDSR